MQIVNKRTAPKWKPIKSKQLVCYVARCRVCKYFCIQAMCEK